LEPGMINSIEPGFYEPGWGGIRLENLYLVIKLSEKDTHGLEWYGFESLTFIPFDPKLISFQELSPTQQQWLQTYYQAILNQIGPTLPANEQAWLKNICSLS
jgi:Xaa-Pro aminopeptidase